MRTALGAIRRTVVQWPLGTDVDPRIVQITQGTTGIGYSGQVTAPAAGAVIAEMPLIQALKVYVYFCICVADTVAVGKRIDLQWRDSTNTLTRAIIASTPAASSRSDVTGALSFAAQERVRAVAGAAGAANSVYTAYMQIWSVP